MGRTVQDTSSTGHYDRRGPMRTPFSEMEEHDIRTLAEKAPLWRLYVMLTDWQSRPRYQRLIQEAIERKRRLPNG